MPTSVNLHKSANLDHIRGLTALPTVTQTAMMYTLVQDASKSWRKITGAERLGEIISGVRFMDGEAKSIAS